ncbi:MAG: hypothetical protein IK065_04025 [Neisseriaceae bacterium]|nr:hypothetical protein [Neisseriaceae bacterium]
MKHNAILIELDKDIQQFALLRAIVQYYQGAKIFILDDYDFHIKVDKYGNQQKFSHTINPQIIDEILEEFTYHLEVNYIEDNWSNWSKTAPFLSFTPKITAAQRQRYIDLQKEINELRKCVSTVGVEYINLSDTKECISVIKIENLLPQACAMLWYIVLLSNTDFVLAPLNTPTNKIVQFVEYDTLQNISPANDPNWGKPFIHNIIKSINELCDNLDFTFVNRLWGDYGVGLLSCADEKMLNIIKKLPENNERYTKRFVDYDDKILLNSCPYDGVYIEPYEQK